MRSRSAADPARGERGAVTAEFAAVVPAVILVLACCLSGLQLSTQQLRLQSAAAVSARSAARGESVPVEGLVDGTTATIERNGNLVCVRVTAPGRAIAGLFGAVTLTASGCALAGGQ